MDSGRGGLHGYVGLIPPAEYDIGGRSHERNDGEAPLQGHGVDQ